MLIWRNLMFAGMFVWQCYESSGILLSRSTLWGPLACWYANADDAEAQSASSSCSYSHHCGSSCSYSYYSGSSSTNCCSPSSGYSYSYDPCSGATNSSSIPTHSCSPCSDPARNFAYTYNDSSRFNWISGWEPVANIPFGAVLSATGLCSRIHLQYSL